MDLKVHLDIKDKIGLGRKEVTDPLFIDFLNHRYGDSAKEVINWIQVSGKTQEINPANLDKFIHLYTKEKDINLISQLLNLSHQFNHDFQTFIQANQSVSTNEMIHYVINSHSDKISDIKQVEKEFSKLLVNAQIEKISSNPFSKKANLLVGIENLPNEQRNLNIKKTLDTILQETPRNEFKMN